jgi:hypothetical protein
MPYFASNQITGSTTAVALTGTVPVRTPVPVTDAVGEVLVQHATIIFPNGTLVPINSIIEMCTLPADHVPVDWALINDDFDSATTMQGRMGLLAGTPGDATRLIANVGAEILAAASTIPQAAAFTRLGHTAAQAVLFGRIAPSTVDRTIAMAVTAAPTDIAADRRMDFLFFYRAARYGA